GRCYACYGPASLPECGYLAPVGGERLPDAALIVLLRDGAIRVSAARWRLGNVDVVVAAERPSLAPHLRQITSNISRALLALFPSPGAQNLVSVKPKRGEGLGSIGRGEGIAVWAGALLDSFEER